MSTPPPQSPPSARDHAGPTGVWLSSISTDPARESAELAAEIERLGYGALWLGEIPTGREAYTQAGLLLAATQRLVLATGIANIWLRDPGSTFAAGQGLGEAYPGRFVLGLGVSHAPLVELRGHDYAKPLTAMRSYLDGMDVARAHFSGAVADPPVPVVLAALRSRMVALARDRSDGAHPYLTTPEHTARTRETLGPGPWLAPEQAVVVESDPSTARRIARGYLALYLTLPNYTANLLDLGFAEADLQDGGSDALVDALVAWGSPEQIAERVDAHREAGADHVAVQPLAPDAGGELEQLRQLAPLLVNGARSI